MSFAYVQGQEKQALAFFEKRLEVARNAEERQQLEEIIAELRGIVGEGKETGFFPGEATLNNSAFRFSD